MCALLVDPYLKSGLQAEAILRLGEGQARAGVGGGLYRGGTRAGAREQEKREEDYGGSVHCVSRPEVGSESPSATPQDLSLGVFGEYRMKIAEGPQTSTKYCPEGTNPLFALALPTRVVEALDFNPIAVQVP